jgi:DNA mismatch repair protein MSH6
MLEYALEARGDGEYIPNSLSLGGINRVNTFENMTQEEKEIYVPRLLLLSGPNMGGKSTLLRQTCLITILAQIGCRVPAESCSMTPVDRIFTRVGASDRILAGQSTFFVELAETAIMLRSATQDSLGTATFDGTAIAHAVVEYLVKRTKCRTLFATHYHSLIHDWDMDPRVKLGHMDCLVDSDKSDAVENVTFLYHLTDGSSPRSYGINVAKLARLPEEVIAMAVEQSKSFEEKLKAFSSNTNSVANSNLNISNYNVVSSFFDRIMSIVDSSMDANEFGFVIAEIWSRLQNIV